MSLSPALLQNKQHYVFSENTRGCIGLGRVVFYVDFGLDI